jgi:magnesium transporter
VLPKLTAEAASELEGLLQYPAHTAGGIMTTEFVQLDPGMTVGAALKHIRAVAREKRNRSMRVMCLKKRAQDIAGRVSLRDLVMAELEKPITDVMRKKPVTVNALDDQEVVAKKIANTICWRCRFWNRTKMSSASSP